MTGRTQSNVSHKELRLLLRSERKPRKSRVYGARVEAARGDVTGRKVRSVSSYRPG